MTYFLDVRALWGGGDVSSVVQLNAWKGGDNYADSTQYVRLSPDDLQSYIHAKDVLIGTHGFNINRAAGIQTLSAWEDLLGPKPFSGAFVGLLWPGDSESLHALSYPVAPKNAMAAGSMVAEFVDNNFANATSISFVSHSLGARVVLQAISRMSRPVRRLILMAGAVGDHCLTAEFATVPAKVETISLLASKEDEVLRWAFPLGDFASEIVDHTHPWWESALGRFGPSARPEHYRGPCQIPDIWKYGHGNYLQTNPPAPASISPPVDVPPQGTLPPTGNGWQEAFSSAFTSTRFR
jgi:pimeloyl-ACP methyl ester carboxylesterase